MRAASPQRVVSPIGAEPHAGPSPHLAKAMCPACRLPESLMDLTAVLRHAVENGASDVHLKVGQPPVLRHDGELDVSDEFPPLGDADLEAVLDQVTIATPRRRQHFDETGELDIAYSEPGLPRFRLNGFRQRGAISFAFRLIPDTIAGFSELFLPAGVSRLAEE